jgi:hypothetical protein
MGEREYSGKETGINTAWTSDLKSSWDDRDEPPDRTVETVGGTTADDFHDSRTSFLPSHLQQEDLTPLQTEIVEAAVSRSQASALDIAVATRASPQWVETVVGEYLPEHPSGVAPEPTLHPDQASLTDFADGEPPASRDDQAPETTREIDGRERREEAKQSLIEQAERAVPEGYDATGKSIQQRYTTCGDPSCHCAEGQGHGPYLYAHWREDGTVRSEYIGKPVSPEDE